MAFERPITIDEALDHIDRDRYLLPSIQREVVWNKRQIQRLFDSLMQGYPIGSFLFWKVREENSHEFTFYEIMQEYHQKNNFRLSRHTMKKQRDITAVLDGQQRLTALNIGLRGSYAQKLPYKWAEFDSNYPKQFLYLRLDDLAEHNEDGLVYDFRFLTPEQAASDPVSGKHWFRVSDILKMNPGIDIHKYVMAHKLYDEDDTTAFEMLHRLHELVHKDAVINYYEERDQDLDKVLNIFIRINSGGTVLTKSDLLLSIATSQWKKVDARETIFGLVDELNSIGHGFAFDKDIVLKAGLLLTDIPSVAFSVRNFNAANMAKLEDAWEDVANALRLAAQLLWTFGLSSASLSANSVLLPIAYYLHKVKATSSYLTSTATVMDRQRVRTWIIRSLLKTGIWGSGLDGLLQALRRALAQSMYGEFPIDALRGAMFERGKSLEFTEEEIQNLSEMSYKDRRTFSFLSLLYPGMDFRNGFHIDHVFPVASFNRSKLAKNGLDEDLIDSLLAKFDLLPNLQLLDGPSNQAKLATPPYEWVQDYFPNDAARSEYLRRHMLGDIPESIEGFLPFFEERQRRIVKRVRDVVGAVPTLPTPDDPANEDL